jgi:hypothetical protein
MNVKSISVSAQHLIETNIDFKYSFREIFLKLNQEVKYSERD